MKQDKESLEKNRCYVGGNFDANIVNLDYKNKIININGIRGFIVVPTIIHTSTSERETFHYAIKNIIEDK